jgi:3-hydroxyacyl-[acyl-carrier-protein] dehydratase
MTPILCDQSLIRKLLPHRKPFLFVDRVISFEAGKQIVAQRFLSADEPFFQGHFPDRPIMPGVLVTEALAQASGLLTALTWHETQGSIEVQHPHLYLATVDMKFISPAEPGESLDLESVLKKTFGNLTLFSVKATVKDRTIAKGTLALGMAPVPR